MKKRFVISGTGCALADNLYTNIDFSTSVFQKYLSSSHADGGLSPGKLVFTEEFEKFAGKKLNEVINEITNGQAANSFNIGGPSIVSLIGAAQLLSHQDVSINFYGAIGNDNIGHQISIVMKENKEAGEDAQKAALCLLFCLEQLRISLDPFRTKLNLLLTTLTIPRRFLEPDLKRRRLS